MSRHSGHFFSPSVMVVTTSAEEGGYMIAYLRSFVRPSVRLDHSETCEWISMKCFDRRAWPTEEIDQFLMVILSGIQIQGSWTWIEIREFLDDILFSAEVWDLWSLPVLKVSGESLLTDAVASICLCYIQLC